MIFAALSAEEKEELWASLALRHAKGIGPLRALKLLRTCGSAHRALRACMDNPEDCSARAGIPLSLLRDCAGGGWRPDAEAEWKALAALGSPFVYYSDPDYPDLLRELGDAPLLLYYKGDISLLRGPAIGVVGSRDCSPDGLAVSSFIARALSRAGVSIVSGLAKGIDRAAHLAGMAGPGRSAGVLGTGIDIIYPSENKDLFASMERDGLLISEFAPATAPLAVNFPRRNRLISGLSRGVLVVEASTRSGSLITARLALEQNREVFAVPGPALAAASAGCRNLIRKGAKAVFNADDILLELAPLLSLDARTALEKRQMEGGNASSEAEKASRHREKADKSGANGVSRARRQDKAGADGVSDARARAEAGPEAMSLSAEEECVLAALGAEPRHIDDLSHSLGFTAARTSASLTLLEVRGLARRSPGMYYSLTSTAP